MVWDQAAARGRDRHAARHDVIYDHLHRGQQDSDKDRDRPGWLASCSCAISDAFISRKSPRDSRGRVGRTDVAGDERESLYQWSSLFGKGRFGYKKTIRDEWSAATRPADGSLVVSPIMDTAYRLTCVGDGVVISKTATIKVGGQASPPSGGDVSVDLAFTASPQVATRGKGTTLRWRSARATSCTASGAWKGERELSSFEGTPVSPGKHSEYRLTCANDFGFAAEMTLTIESQDSPKDFTPSLLRCLKLSPQRQVPLPTRNA